jgi:gliding motility-associated-like protein
MNLTNIPAGLYSLEVTDGNGCSDNFGPFSVANPGAPSAPTITVSANQACDGEDVDFSVSSSDASATFDWSGPNGFSSNLDNFTITLDEFTVGNYCVTATVSNCTSPSACETIVLNELPTLDVTSDSEGTLVCENSNVELTATGASTLVWSGPDGFSGNGSPVSLTNSSVSSTGWYIVTGTDGNNCSSIDSTYVEVVPLPTADAEASSDSQNAFCEGSVGFLYGSGGDIFGWTGPNGFTSTNQNPTIANFDTNNVGTYILTVTDGNNCSSIDSTYVEVAPLPTADAEASSDSQTAFCEGSVGFLYGSGGDNFGWTGPNGFTSTNQNPTIANFDTTNVGTYILTVTDVNGCQDQDSTSLDVSVFEDVFISAGDTVLCPGDLLSLSANGAEDYIWTGPNGFSESGQNISIDNISMNQSGTYYVEGTSAFGCTGEDEVEVAVEMDSDCLFIPGLVTPNDDNMNDFWIITGITNYPDAEVSIYNRWGNLVYFISPYENDWGGQVNRGVNVGDGSGRLPTGTYFYIVKLNDGVTDPFKGYIELQY